MLFSVTSNENRVPTIIDRVSAFFAIDQPLWFLHRERFRAAISSSTTSFEHPHPTLLTSVCALGTYGATTGDLAHFRPILKTAALSSVNCRLSPSDPGYVRHTLQLIQARLLLGGMLMNAGEALQGGSMLSGACSLALSLGLHNLYDATPRDVAVIPVPIGRPPPPTNGVEAAERAGAFWVACHG